LQRNSRAGHEISKSANSKKRPGNKTLIQKSGVDLIWGRKGGRSVALLYVVTDALAASLLM